MKLKGVLTLTLSACVAVTVPIRARASSCTGTVTVPATCTGTLDAESGTPGSVVTEGFTLSSPSAVTIYTTSYGGGMNLNGSSTSAGGFQPNITLFDTTGFAVAFENGATSPIANTDPSTGWKADGYIYDPNVAPGSYFAILTDVNNQVSPSFSGFGSTPPSDFYTFFSGPGGTTFEDLQGNTRDGHYALDISATTTATPEPATGWLILPALLAGALLARRRRLPAN